MLIGEEFLLSQPIMDRREGTLIIDARTRGFHMRNQLRRIFIAGLTKVHVISHPQRGSFLAVASIQVIGRIDQLGCGQSWLNTPLATLLAWLKLVFPNRAQRGDGGQRFEPVRCTGSIQRLQQGPAISSHLIGVLLTFFFLLWQALMLQSLPIALDPLWWHVPIQEPPPRAHSTHRPSSERHTALG